MLDVKDRRLLPKKFDRESFCIVDNNQHNAARLEAFICGFCKPGGIGHVIQRMEAADQIKHAVSELSGCKDIHRDALPDGSRGRGNH